MLDYSIVIPAYNEKARISKTLTQISCFMANYAPSYEIIVVDDGSTDETVEVTQEYITENPQVRLIKNPHKGKSVAVRTGMLEATGKLIYMCDADMSTPIEELKRMAIWINDNDFDVVIASREGLGAQRKNEPLYRHIMGRVFNFYVKFLTGLKYKDTQCGFKLFKNEASKQLFSSLLVYGNNVKESKKPFFGAFDVEVLYIAKVLGYSVKEVPVQWIYAPTTRLNPLVDSLKMAKDVFLIKLNGLKGKYRKDK